MFLITIKQLLIPEFYQPIIDAVAAKGYEIKGLHLPRAGLKTDQREGMRPTMYDDTAFITKEVEKLADEGKDVVLLAHSYGGVPTTQSTKGLSKAERKVQGKGGGIVRLAYMTAIVPAVGANAGEFMAEVLEEYRLGTIVNEQGWLTHESVEKAAAICFSDLSKEDGEAWMKTFVYRSAIAFEGELTHAGYKDIPVSWLFCERDLCIPPANQQKGIDEIERVSGKKVHVTSIAGGHVPNIGNEKEVVGWVLSVAEEGSSKS